MQKTINRLHRLLLADANQGNGNLGALVIVGNATDSNNGKCTSFSGGNTLPITMGLVKEMQRDPGILAAVKLAVTIVDNKLTQAN
jgi:hypothetical protein